MDYVLILGLAIWVLVLQSRVTRLDADLKTLKWRPRDQPGESLPPAPHEAEPPPFFEPVPAYQPPRPQPPPPLPQSAPALASVATAGVVVMPDFTRTPAPETPPPAAAGPDPAPPASPPMAIGAWLAENGLAWLGGGALALGGVLLVAYAASQGFFTPPLRLFAALAAGTAMLGAGETIRRRVDGPGGRHALAAAAASGAGAATLYATVWAAYSLYHFIPLAPAVALLALVSLGLLGLALIHGEALAVLAVFGAMIAPALCDPPAWRGVALDGYLVAIAATGLAIAGRRGWGWTGAVTLTAVVLWTLARGVAGDWAGMSALPIAATAFAILAAQGRVDAPAADDSTRVLLALPGAALLASSLIWLPVGLITTGFPIATAALAVLVLVLLAGAGARLRLTIPGLVFAPAASLALFVIRRTIEPAGVVWSQSALWFLAPALGLLATGVVLARQGERRVEAAVAGAAGATLVLTLSRAALAQAMGSGSPSLFAAMALASFAGAAVVALRSPERRTDLALAAYVGAGAEAVGLAIHTGLAGRPEPASYAVLGVALALAGRRLPWRGLTESAALAVLFSLLALLGPAVAGAAFAGHVGWTDLAVGGGLTALIQLAAWQTLPAEPARTREAVSTVAVITIVLTVFLALRLLATARGNAAPAIDLFTEGALRTDFLLVAGLGLTVRSGPSWLSRARGPVFLGLGVLHGVICGLWLPLMLEAWRAAQGGPPIVDALALALLFPAVLLALAARRMARDLPLAWGAAAVSAMGFLSCWTFGEIHRLFQPSAPGAVIALHAEYAAYAAGALVLAWVATLGADRRLLIEGRETTRKIVEGGRWAALLVAAWVAAVTASPWWGPQAGELPAPLAFFAAEALVIVLSLLFWPRAARQGETAFAIAVRCAATAEIFAVMTLLIRFAFHGEDMRSSLAQMSWETWTYSAAWALYGLIVLAGGARRSDPVLRGLGLVLLLGTTAKVFLFDMATLDGVVRASSFLALGALLLVGALAARRLSARAPKD